MIWFVCCIKSSGDLYLLEFSRISLPFIKNDDNSLLDIFYPLVIWMIVAELERGPPNLDINLGGFQCVQI